GTDYIAMEYVDGKTLATTIAEAPGGRMPVRDVLRYAVQISDGLRTAHAAGIVHRDLKPANIMLTRAGIVKVLDFGVAKIMESSAAETAAPTRTQPAHTQHGVVLGTAAYMSPEQAEGRPIDSRTDVFSFGAVVYEMLTGHRAFERATPLATLSAVVNDDPKSI